MNRVALIQTGLSNIDSVRRAVEEVGGQPYVVSTALDLAEPDHIVLPGVGSFLAAMERLRATRIDEALKEQVQERGIPLLGVCLGMQLLMSEGEEGGTCAGLDLIKGSVCKLGQEQRDRVPHVGWNEVHPVRSDSVLAEIGTGTDFYFVHSFRVIPEQQDRVVATTPYCGDFVSIVRSEAVVGVQFHPEKSHQAGLRLLRNFVES